MKLKLWLLSAALGTALVSAALRCEVAQDSLEPGQTISGTVLPSPASSPSAIAESLFPMTASAAALTASASVPTVVPSAVPTRDCGVIKPAAGSGTAAFGGDNGPAVNAELSGPSGVAVGPQGSLYIADRNNHVIRKVGASGVITSVAGDGTAGFSGDGGSAIYAELDAPTGICVDKAGNLYIADTLNARIRKVDGFGNITTLAGDGLRGYNGDGGSALSAALNAPEGVCLDAAGNLYFSDEADDVVRKVDLSGIVTTVAGTGAPGYSGDNGLATAAGLAVPVGVSVDRLGNLYIADEGNNVVRKVDASGNITTIAGGHTAGYSGDGGDAVSAELDRPYAVVVDGTGDLFIADGGNHVVRKVDSEGNISTVVGNGMAGSDGDYGPAVYAQLNAPEGLALDSIGDLYIADLVANQVRRVDCP